MIIIFFRHSKQILCQCDLFALRTHTDNGGEMHASSSTDGITIKAIVIRDKTG